MKRIALIAFLLASCHPAQLMPQYHYGDLVEFEHEFYGKCCGPVTHQYNTVDYLVFARCERINLQLNVAVTDIFKVKECP